MKVKAKEGKIELPKLFKLFGSTYNICIDNTVNDIKGTLGLFSVDDKEISLATCVGLNELPSDTILDTYYHELSHALVKNTGEEEYYKDEKFIDLLGKLLRQYVESVKY